MNKSSGFECLAWTWGIAILVGCVIAAALWGLGGWSFMQGAFMGVLCLLILGALLTLMMCRGSSGPAQASTAGVNRTASATSAAVPAAAAAAAPAAASVDTSAADAAAAAKADADAAAKAAAKADADAAAKASAKADTDAAAAKADADAATAKVKADADAAAAKAKAKAKADADAAAASAAAASAAAATPTPAPAPAAAAAPQGEGIRPAALDGPRGGTADDLKRIKGVGPKMEQLCNSLGFYHFDQIAAWTPDEVQWVDQNLKGFKGRVSRDTWVDQAGLLASGGETAFSKKVDDGSVY